MIIRLFIVCAFCFRSLEEEPGFYSVAAIHQFANISDLLHLRGRRACFSSVGDMAGWVVPMAHLIENRVLEVSSNEISILLHHHFSKSIRVLTFLSAFVKDKFIIRLCVEATLR